MRKKLVLHLDHLSCGTVGHVRQRAILLGYDLVPQGVNVVPVMLEPGWQEPDVALLLGHALLVGLAKDVPGRGLVEFTDQDPSAPLLQILEVLWRRQDVC